MYSFNLDSETKKIKVMLKLNSIKKNGMMFFMGTLLLGGFASCSDDDTNTTTQAISEQEAVDAIEASVSTETNGAAKMMADASEVAMDAGLYTDTPEINCGEVYTSGYDVVYGGTSYSYDYTGTRNYQVNCTNLGVPSTFQYNFSMEGDYETPRLVSDDNAQSSLVVTGLAFDTAEATFNGTYTRSGYQESKVLQQRHFNSVLNFTVNNVLFNKNTLKITGGTASVVFEGVGSDGNSYTFNGSITFNGNDTATLIINNNSYTINL